MDDLTDARPPEGASVTRVDDELRISIDGQFDNQLSNWLYKVTQRPFREPVVRLWVRRLKGVSSAFVGILMAIQRDLASRRKKLVLVNPSSRLRDMIHVMHLKDQLDVRALPYAEVPISDHQLVAEPYPGIRHYRTEDTHILVLEGDYDPVSNQLYNQAVRKLADEISEPLAIHVGEIAHLSESLPRLLLELFRHRRGQNLVTMLLNPTLEFESLLLELEAQDRIPFVTDLNRELPQILGPF